MPATTQALETHKGTYSADWGVARWLPRLATLRFLQYLVSDVDCIFCITRKPPDCATAVACSWPAAAQPLGRSGTVSCLADAGLNASPGSFSTTAPAFSARRPNPPFRLIPVSGTSR